MESIPTSQHSSAVDALRQEAQALLEPACGIPTAPSDDITGLLCQAAQLVHMDIYVVQRMKQAGGEPNYLAILQEGFDEKIAALMFLAKQAMLQLESHEGTPEAIELARTNLALYVEILFRVKAVEALATFYDLAVSRRESCNPQFWQNTCARCLYLMALLQDCRPNIVAFLAERTEARTRLQELAASGKQGIADAARALWDEYQRTDLNKPIPLVYAHYITIYRQKYEHVGQRQSLSRDEEERIRLAFETRNAPALAGWIADGAPAAAKAVFRQVLNGITTDFYLSIFAQLLDRTDVPEARMAAAVLALSDHNRRSGVREGAIPINNLLMDVALTPDADALHVALIAVGELEAIEAIMALTRIMEHAALVPVAADAIQALMRLRNLPPTPGGIAQRSPTLLQTYQNARQQLMALNNLVESACAAPTEELSLQFLLQLKESRAIPELKKLSQGRTRASLLAQRVLSEMQSERQNN